MTSFRSKLICILMGVSLVPLIAATICSYYISSQNLYEKVNLATMTSMEMISRGIDNELQRLITDMDISASSKEFQHALNQLRLSKTDGERWVALRDMDEMMIGMFGKSASVTGVYLTMPDGYTYALQDKYHMNLNTFSHKEWFVGSDVLFSSILSRGIVTMDNGKKALIFGKLIRDVTDLGNLAEIGSVHFAIDPSLFTTVIADSGEDSVLLILNEDSQIVASYGTDTKLDLLYQTITDHADQMSDKEGILLINSEGTKTNLIYHISSLYRYQIIRFIPLSDYNSEVTQITRVTLFIALICTIAVIIVSILVSRNISKPLNTLNKSMQYTEKGNFDTQLHCTRRDELGDMTRSFNQMVRQLDAYFTQSINDEKAKKNLEIRSLQYQISPHFLYNLLASIRSLAVLEKAEQTGLMLGAVSKLLKNTVGYAGTLIPLYREIENISRLLYIQNICHNNMVQWNMDIQSGTEEYLVPNLIMQPIVENAVFYSADADTGQVLIDIHVQIEDNKLKLMIQDHGQGISAERKLEIFHDSSHKGHFTHVGLQNTRERIRLNFGEPYDLIVNSDTNGTQVVILLPLLTEDPSKPE